MAVTILTRGPRQGVCNICGQHGDLTEDHTPPKGCIKVSQVELHHIIKRLAEEESHNHKGRISQNGVKFRTLCKRCNNTLLGTDYDPSLISFVNHAGAFLRSGLQLPSETTIKGHPQKIVRAVLGHLSAQGVDRYLKGPETEALRDYMFDTNLPLPEGISVHYWPYPYRPQVIIRDAAFSYLPSQQVCAIWLLKFFPIAFLVTWRKPSDLKFHVANFDPWRSSPFNYEAELPLVLRPIIHEYWPEAPTDHSIVVYGREAMVADLWTAKNR